MSGQSTPAPAAAGLRSAPSKPLHLPREARLTDSAAPRALRQGFMSDDQLERLGDLLDTRFSLFGIRFGLDGVLSLVPVLGDVVGTGASALIFADAWKAGARKRTLAKMAGNLGLDFVFGSIPVIGTIFDVGFKANVRNLALLRQERERLAAEVAAPARA